MLLTKLKYLSGLQCPKLLWILFNEKNRIPENDKITEYRFLQEKIVEELELKKVDEREMLASVRDFLAL